MSKSRYGIYTNIEESDYFFMANDFVFYFSSESYKNKFIKRIDNYILEEKRKELDKYSINITPIMLLYIYYYSTLEKRGFRVYKWEGQEKVRISKEKPLVCKVG